MNYSRGRLTKSAAGCESASRTGHPGPRGLSGERASATMSATGRFVLSLARPRRPSWPVAAVMTISCCLFVLVSACGCSVTHSVTRRASASASPCERVPEHVGDGNIARLPLHPFLRPLVTPPMPPLILLPMAQRGLVACGARRTPCRSSRDDQDIQQAVFRAFSPGSSRLDHPLASGQCPPSERSKEPADDHRLVLTLPRNPKWPDRLLVGEQSGAP